MRAPVAAAVAFVLIGATSSEAAGQSVSDVFDRVHRSVVVIRTSERHIDDQRPVSWRRTALCNNHWRHHDSR